MRWIIVFNNAKHEEFMLNVWSMWESQTSPTDCNIYGKTRNFVWYYTKYTEPYIQPTTTNPGI